MNLLYRIVYATHANGTHHKLALDALRHLHSPDAERWQRLFLQHAEVYLEGSKAPDKQFKDFKNHVLHVGDNFWGGAPEKVESWYRKLVGSLKAQSWHEAVWAAGIMSHYYTDPIHPFHTAQSKAENEIHRAVEWSISKSYGALAEINSGKPAPEILLGTDGAWIKDHVIAGAEKSHQHYETLIAHYNFERGVVDPPAGLDDVSRKLTADLLQYAAVGHARLLDRAIAEAGVTPPDVSLTVEMFIAALKIPVKWVTRKMENAADRAEVEAIYDELNSTGTVEHNLPADDRQVRDLHQREVLDRRTAERNAQRSERRTSSPLAQGQIPRLDCAAKPASTSRTRPSARPDRHPQSETKHGPATSVPTTKDARPLPSTSLGQPPANERDTASDSTNRELPRTYLTPSDELEAAPSIGSKTAARFEKIGIVTVEQFLQADPEATAKEIATRYITANTIIEWQHQARLVCELPGIRGTHAQLLVGAGLTTLDDIAQTDPGEAMAEILKFAQTSAGQSLLRDGRPPDLEKIHIWVQNARDAKAAA